MARVVHTRMGMRTTALLAALMLAPTFAHAEEAETKMNSKSLFVAGLVAEGAGLTAMSVGGVLAVLGAAIHQPVPTLACIEPCPPYHPPPNVGVIAGATLLAIGGAVTVAGIPLIVIGAKRVAVEPTLGGASLRMTF